MFTFLGGVHFEGKRHIMFVSQPNKNNCKCTCYCAEIYQVISEQIHYQYFYGLSLFLWRAFILSTLTNWNHQPYIWHNFILVYQIKVIKILVLLQEIFMLFFASFFPKGS